MDVITLARELGKAIQADERYAAYNAAKKVRTLYGEIMSTESMTKFNEAKTALDELVNSVNTIITMSVNGQDPDTVDPTASCSGDCSACGGCH